MPGKKKPKFSISLTPTAKATPKPASEPSPSPSSADPKTDDLEKQAEEQALADFIRAFDSAREGTADSGRKRPGQAATTFVRGGVFQAGQPTGERDDGADEEEEEQELYHLDPSKREARVERLSRKKGADPMKEVDSFFQDLEAQVPVQPRPVADKREDRIAAMQEFFEELQQHEQHQGDRARDPFAGIAAGRYPTSTNIYIANLAPTVTEETLERRFGRYGPLASIKIMWPRSEAERAKETNYGFVAFMRRPDAEAAMRELQLADLAGCKLSLFWARPLRPEQLATPYRSRLQDHHDRRSPRSSSPSRGRSRSHEKERGREEEKREDEDSSPRRHRSRSTRHTEERRLREGNEDEREAEGEEQDEEMLGEEWEEEVEERGPPPNARLVRVAVPEDRWVRRLIDRWAEFVVRDGPELEAMLMRQERDDEDREDEEEEGEGGGGGEDGWAGPRWNFRFLFQPRSPEGIYYRWRVYSRLQGDGRFHWRERPFQMVQGEDKPWWVPPPSRHRLKRERRRQEQRAEREERKEAEQAGYGVPDRHTFRRRRNRWQRIQGDPAATLRAGDWMPHVIPRWKDDGVNGEEGGCLSASSSGESLSSVSLDSGSTWSSADDSDGGIGFFRRGRRARGRRKARGRQTSRSPSPPRFPVGGTRSGGDQPRAGVPRGGREPLSRADFNAWRRMLEDLSVERAAVREAMVFCMDRADSAAELSEVLCESMLLPGTSNPLRIARLYLLSDVLHNCASPHVRHSAAFRLTFQGELPRVMAAFAVARRRIEGRMSQAAFEDKVLRVLASWQRAGMFPPGFLNGLEATFLRQPEDEGWREEVSESIGEEDEKEWETLRRESRRLGLLDIGGSEYLRRQLAWAGAYSRRKAFGEPLYAPLPEASQEPTPKGTEPEGSPQPTNEARPAEPVVEPRRGRDAGSGEGGKNWVVVAERDENEEEGEEAAGDAGGGGASREELESVDGAPLTPALQGAMRKALRQWRKRKLI